MLRALVNYSILAIPLAFTGLPVYIYAPDFYAREFNIPINKLGLALLILRIFDAVQDPIIGIISDKFHHLRKQILFSGLLLLIIGFWTLFNPSKPNIIWFCFAIIISTTGYSIANINYLALGGLWPVKIKDSSKITSWRETCGLTGLILAASLPGFFSEPKIAFKFISISLVPITCIAAVLLNHWYKNTQITIKTNTIFKFKLNRWNKIFFIIYFINSFASSIPAVLVIFFIKDTLQASNLVGFFLLFYFFSAAIAMPIWHFLAKRFTKLYAWIIGTTLASISFIWAFYLEPANAKYFFFICIISGAALGADLALPPAIIADRIQIDKLARQASQYFAGINFLNKIALALAAGACLPILAKLGYKPGTSSAFLGYAYALIPSIIKMLATIMLFFFINWSQNANWGHNNGHS